MLFAYQLYYNVPDWTNVHSIQFKPLFTFHFTWSQSIKSPGPDGPTIEFYRTFWKELSVDLCDLYNNAYEHLSTSQTSSLLRLLFKKGDRRNLKNWRPIALLNTDYKILATTLANRLRPTLQYVIHENQTCGIPGRTIYVSMHTVRDMAYDLNFWGTLGIFVNLDQEKAFDRIDKTFLQKVSRKLNCGSSFRRFMLEIMVRVWHGMIATRCATGLSTFTVVVHLRNWSSHYGNKQCIVWFSSSCGKRRMSKFQEQLFIFLTLPSPRFRYSKHSADNYCLTSQMVKFIADRSVNKEWICYGRYWIGFMLALIKPEWHGYAITRHHMKP